MNDYLDRLRDILHDLNKIEVQENCENAIAIKALKSIVYELAECVGDYINEND